MKKQLSERARFEVLMEDVQSQLKIVAEGHSGLDRRMDSLDRKIDSVSEALEQKIGSLDQKVIRLEQKTEHGFAMLGQRIGFVESAVLDVRGDIKRLDQRMANMEHRFGEHLLAHSTQST